MTVLERVNQFKYSFSTIQDAYICANFLYEECKHVNKLLIEEDKDVFFSSQSYWEDVKNELSKIGSKALTKY